MTGLETVSICPKCGSDAGSYYEERPDGVYLHLDCAEHGHAAEKVESDPAFFRWMYEQDYDPRSDHVVLPITYRCNLKCKYCYTLSNSSYSHPADRPLSKIVEYAARFGTSTNLIGGEPTLRDDLPDIISAIKDADGRRILSIGTNGQRLTDLSFVQELKERGLDFVFLSLNHPDYEGSPGVWKNKTMALENCLKAGLPVWLQRTVDRLYQLDDLEEIIGRYKKIIFQVTIRSVKPFGMVYPTKEIFISEMIKYLGKEKKITKGSLPFNCYIRLSGKKVKLCSWANDAGRLDYLDYSYMIADDRLTTFHRGMRLDEILLKTGAWRRA